MSIDIATTLVRRMVGKPGGPIVLMYHSLSRDAAAVSRWTVSAGSFRQQMQYLRREGWVTVRVDELADPARLSPRTVAITFDDGYLDNYQYGFPVLEESGMRATWFVVSGDLGGMSRWQDPEVSAKPMMDPQQLREMSGAGMEIGAHSRRHADLTGLDRRALRDEVAGSRSDLEDILGHSVTSFAYPYGRYDENVLEAVGTAGFERSVTTDCGVFDTRQNPLKIPRIGVFGEDNLSSFSRKLLFADTEVSWPKLLGKFSGGIRHNSRRAEA